MFNHLILSLGIVTISSFAVLIGLGFRIEVRVKRSSKLCSYAQLSNAMHARTKS